MSIFCNLNKIFETMIFSRLKNFFDFQSLLSKNYFYIREHKNTGLKQKYFAVCTFLVFIVCFVTVDRVFMFDTL